MHQVYLYWIGCAIFSISVSNASLYINAWPMVLYISSALRRKTLIMDSSSTTQAKVPRSRKWKAGTVANREIKKLSRSTNTLLPRAPFNRLVRELSNNYGLKIRWSAKALKTIQEASESYTTESLQRANTARGLTGHKTLNVKHLQYSHCACNLMPGQEM